MLLIGSFAGVDPFVVDVQRFRQEVDGSLKILVADCALDPPGVF